MNEIKLISEYFLLSMALGLSFFSFLVNTKLTGAGFFRLLQSIIISSVVILFIISFFNSTNFLLQLFYSLLIVTIIATYRFHTDEKSKLMWGLYFIQNILLLLASFSLYSSETQVFLNFFLSTMLVGITTYAMVLGHYYLVVPKLSEKPLLYAIEILWVALILKMGSSSVNLIKHYDFFQEGTLLGSGYAFNWMLLLMRVLWGYVALFVMSIFAWKLCRMRSIQSATGVFYVMVFFMIVGELISNFMQSKYGLML